MIQQQQAQGKASGSAHPKKPDYHNVVAAHILDQEHVFCSKAFIIRYSEEEVELNNIIQFRSEIDTTIDYARTPFYFEVELLYSDFVANGNAERALATYLKEVTKSTISFC